MPEEPVWNDDNLRRQMRRIRPAEVEYKNIQKPDLTSTIGLEIESVAIRKESLELMLLSNSAISRMFDNFKITRDGSGEMHFYPCPVSNQRGIILDINGDNLYSQTLLGKNFRKFTYGYEIVTRPMSRENMSGFVNLVLPVLEMNGDFLSKRCATHVHVGTSNNLSVLKSALRLGLYFEDLIYAMSGMGYEFRGGENNSIYARPLAHGPFISSGRNYYQIGNPEVSLEANSIAEFFYPYHFNLMGPIEKYVPARYFSINLYSVLQHGTIEFRTWNQSLNARYINAIIEFCQAFTEMANLGDNKEINSLSTDQDVFRWRGKEVYQRKLNEFIYLTEQSKCTHEVSDEARETLTELIDINPPYYIGEKEVKTHSRNIEVDMELVKLGKLKRPIGEPKNPNNIDIHNIKFISILR